MKRFRRFAIAAVFVALVVAIFARCVVIVDETEYVLVTDFGRISAVYGEAADDAGPHVKWPWQSTRAVDRRQRVFEPPAREVITGDKRNLEVSCYVVWRVAAPVRFVQAGGSLDAAEARLNERVAAAISDAVGRRQLAALASTDLKVWGLDALSEEIGAAVARGVLDDLGVEVVDVRLRRFNHPVEVRPAVFDLIRSERQQVAAALRAEGEADYQSITSRAERERDTILAQADAEAERLRGQGDAEAARISNEAHARDPKFFEFLRTLDTYRALLDDKSTVVLSSSSPLLKLLTHGPSDELQAEPSPAATERKP
jgi:modulator of FtsH protease HflC